MERTKLTLINNEIITFEEGEIKSVVKKMDSDYVLVRTKDKEYYVKESYKQILECLSQHKKH